MVSIQQHGSRDGFVGASVSHLVRRTEICQQQKIKESNDIWYRYTLSLDDASSWL